MFTIGISIKDKNMFDPKECLPVLDKLNLGCGGHLLEDYINFGSCGDVCILEVVGALGQKIRAAHAAAAMAPKNIFPPGSVSMQRTGLGPRRFKKGGRVTGAAKRGFGRALMKGKK